MVLVIDSHTPVERTNTVEKLCQDFGVEAHAVNSVAQAQSDLVKGPQLVLLHCGDQADAAEALKKLENQVIVAYYGGWSPNEAAAVYFATNPSQNHGLIPEAVALGLEPDSDAAKKLKNCLELILRQRRLPPDAVEVVYGDPELEELLNDLYRKLLPWSDLDEIRKARNERLGEYYDEKQGWTTTVTESKARRGRADAVVAHLTAGAFPDQNDAARLLYAAEIKMMRELVAQRPALVERMLQIAESETGARPAFALALIRHACSQPEIAARLRRLFGERAEADHGLACHLVWRVLDDPDLPGEWHKRLINYLIDNWDDWKRHLAEFKEPGPDGMIPVILGRLDDPTYPSSKKWIYLLCLPDGLASDRHEAERMIRGAARSDEENIRSVAEALLSRFYN